jgi:hypothetical protein
VPSIVPSIRPLLLSVATLTLLAAPALPTYAAQRPHVHDGASVPSSPQRLAISDLRVGADPEIPDAVATSPGPDSADWRLVHPDGSTVTLPQLTWSVWAPIGDGAIGVAGTDSGPLLQRVSGDGSVRTRSLDHFGLVVSPDHDLVGWLGNHRRPQVAEDGGDSTRALPRISRGRTVAALRGEGTCREQEPEGGGCTVFANGPRRPWLVTSHGIVAPVRPMRSVSDVNQRGRVAGLTGSRAHACWGVYRADGHRAFSACGYYLDAFSPDGRRVLAEHAQVRWSSVRRFAVLGGDGHVVRAWTFHPGPSRSLTQLTWEDDQHLLAVLRAHGTWGMVRIGVDGTVEYAGVPVAGADGPSPFDLPER